MASPGNAEDTTTTVTTNTRGFTSCIHIIWQCLRTLNEKSWCKLVNTTKMVKKVGEDDPRRVIHSFKVGLALVLISILQYLHPTFYAFGDNILWAVLTVALVLEFSVAGSVTFMRFAPGLKARYDYGFIIFILTFCLISLSDDKETAMLKVAQERLLTIIIGSFVAVTVCICICPVWIGQDLHNQIASNMEKIAHFFEGFSDEYLKKSENTEAVDDKSFLHRYKSVLSSKSSEETMAVLARWEPCHGRFRFGHPWKQYLKIGNLIRLCAYNIEALIACLAHSEQGQYELGSKIRESCTIISSECGKTLKEASLIVKHMTMSSMPNSHVANAKNAIQCIKSILRTNPWEGVEVDYAEIIQVSTLASLLIDVVNCTQNICEAVDELASLAKFQPSQQLHHRGTLVQPVDDAVHVIAIIETPPISELRNEN
ncbi:unnamed protein product [Lupinus luteus]|uniref:Aluminum-activated malate transporter n=1 Tax=Lupinus luteus TaxID=3873 RepID=A0AAV1XLL9_LUPLU